MARPPASDIDRKPDAARRAAHRAAQRDTTLEIVNHYNPEAVKIPASVILNGWSGLAKAHSASGEGRAGGWPHF